MSQVRSRSHLNNIHIIAFILLTIIAIYISTAHTALAQTWSIVSQQCGPNCSPPATICPVTPLLPSTQPSSCTAAETSGNGECFIYSNNAIITQYPNAGNAQLTTTYSSTTSEPQISSVLDYNKRNAQWLLTCPVTPNQQNTQEYFSSSPFIGGDSCLADTTPLETTLELSTHVNWNDNCWANAIDTFFIDNPVQGSIQNLAYTGQSIVQGSSSYKISNGYATNSYIFDSVPTSPQAGIWSWFAKFVNFGLADTKKISNTLILHPTRNETITTELEEIVVVGNQTFVYHFTNITNCKYNYTYNATTDFNSIKNANVPIPTQTLSLPQTNYFKPYSNGPIYTSVFPETGVAQPFLSCGWSLNVAWGVWFFCNSQGFLGQYNEVYDGTGIVSYQGSAYSHLHVYTNSKDTYNPNDPNAYYASLNVGGWGCIPSFPILCSYLIVYSAGSKSTLLTANVPIIPYMIYNISAPVLQSDVNGGTEFLDLSFDLYSPHNYLAPANYLDPFPLQTGSTFLVTTRNTLGTFLTVFNANELDSTSRSAFSSNSYFTILSTLSQHEISSLGLPDFNVQFGNYVAGEIKNPAYIAITPNDYIYVLKYIPNNCGFWCFTASDTYLYVMRLIPIGDYNLSNYKPNSTIPVYIDKSLQYPSSPSLLPQQLIISTNQLVSASAWNSVWVSYWENSLREQSRNLYVTNAVKVSTTNMPCQFHQTRTPCQPTGFTFPNFVPTGLTSDYADDIFMVGYSWGASITNQFDLASIFSNGTSKFSTIHGSDIPGGFSPSSQIAASPGGQYIYLANPSYPYIVIFASNALTPVGKLDLSYGSTIYDLNIQSYLANGGPYNTSDIRTEFATALPTNDVDVNHHPIALAENQGILYVLDNWSFNVGSSPSTILMLRAFLLNGTELPIKSSPFDDMVAKFFPPPPNPGRGALPINPPYGWPLSVNISGTSYCVALCTYTPNSIELQGSDYLPIGPLISSYGGIAPLDSFGLSGDFNGNLYMLVHASTSIFGQNCFGNQQREGGCVPTHTYTPVYTELLRFTPLIQNYTKLSLAAHSPYNCFINVSAQASPCIYAPNITDLYPPLAFVPSSFDFMVSEGIPRSFFSILNVETSLFPTGASSGGPSSSDAQNTIASENQLPGLISQSINSAGLSIPPNAVSLNSILSGFFLVPYNAVYSLHQKVESTKSKPISASGPQVPGFSAQSLCENFNPYKSPPPSSITSFNGFSASQSNTVVSNSLFETVEGGPTFLQYIATQQPYIANLSDADTILPPSIYYSIFTDRLLDNVYVNLTVASNGRPQSPALLSPQQVINATKTYNYATGTVEQLGHPAYAIQEAIPITPPQVGPTFIPSRNPSVYRYSNEFSYTPTQQVSFMPLFAVYYAATYLNALKLTFPDNPNILGYNRFMFTYIDTFNNIIYMPLDADIANSVIISLDISPVINPTNTNETTVNVTGTAGFKAGALGETFVPLPAGFPIYLYFDDNINYYNSTLTPPSSDYYKYATDCAYWANAPYTCALANPVLKSQMQNGFGPFEANYISYQTQYNSLTLGTCAPPPNSLIEVQPVDCNIYGNYSLPMTGTSRATGAPEYCQQTDILTGNGILTSQLGLFGIAKTDSNGMFSNTLNVCGSGTGHIMAKFYGSPSPQPVTVYQQPLSESANMLFSPQESYEYSYVFSPAQTSIPFNFGSVNLGVGSISAIIGVLLTAALVIFLILKRSLRRP